MIPARRKLLKTIASLPLAAFLSQRTSFGRNGVNVLAAPAPQVQMTLLSVIFHGLYAIVCDKAKSRLRVYIPYVDISEHVHVYRAGSWNPPIPPADCSNKQKHEDPLAPSDEYTLNLVGYNGTDFPVPDTTSEVWISPTKTAISIDPLKVFCTLNLPLTPYLTPVHKITKIRPVPFFSGKTATDNNITLTTLARTYILTYASAKPFTPTLTSSNGQIFWQPQSNSDALHIFSEPERLANTSSGPNIGIDAFNHLIALLGNPPLTFVPFQQAELALAEVQPEPENYKSLGERYNDLCGTSLGGETANCVALFVYPAP